MPPTDLLTARTEAEAIEIRRRAGMLDTVNAPDDAAACAALAEARTAHARAIAERTAAEGHLAAAEKALDAAEAERSSLGDVDDEIRAEQPARLMRGLSYEVGPALARRRAQTREANEKISGAETTT